LLKTEINKRKNKTKKLVKKMLNYLFS
jgi:hypothetical protein